MNSEQDPLPPDVVWHPAWGYQVQAGDILRVVKLGGVVVVDTVTKFYNTRSGPSITPEEGAAWYLGIVCHDMHGADFHLVVQPTEAVFIGSQVPTDPEVLTDGDRTE